MTYSTNLYSTSPLRLLDIWHSFQRHVPVILHMIRNVVFLTSEAQKLNRNQIKALYQSYNRNNQIDFNEDSNLMNITRCCYLVLPCSNQMYHLPNLSHSYQFHISNHRSNHHQCHSHLLQHHMVCQACSSGDHQVLHRMFYL